MTQFILKTAPISLLLGLLTSCSSGGSNSIVDGSTSSSSSSSSSSSLTYSQQQLTVDIAEVIVNGYALTTQKFHELNTAAYEFCDLPSSTEQYNTLQQTWREATLAWQYIQFINFGPAKENSRRQKISRYPITSSALISNNITDLLASSDEITEAHIAAESAPTQGLPALEYILFTDNAYNLITDQTHAIKYCEIITSISENLNTLLAEITVEWEPSGQTLLDFTDPSLSQDTLGSLFFDISYNLLDIHDAKISDALAGTTYAIESPFAQQSLPNIGANIQLILDVLSMNGNNGLDALLQGNDLLAESEEFKTRLQNLKSNLDSETQSLTTLLQSPEGIKNIEKKQLLIHDVFEYLVGTISTKLNISINLSLFGEGD